MQKSLLWRKVYASTYIPERYRQRIALHAVAELGQIWAWLQRVVPVRSWCNGLIGGVLRQAPASVFFHYCMQ